MSLDPLDAVLAILPTLSRAEKSKIAAELGITSPPPAKQPAASQSPLPPSLAMGTQRIPTTPPAPSRENCRPAAPATPTHPCGNGHKFKPFDLRWFGLRFTRLYCERCGRVAKT